MEEATATVTVIYKILTGLEETEYYTFDIPSFTNLNELVCTNVISKMSINTVVVNKTITSYYSSDKIESKTFNLSDGVIIKTETGDLDWLHATKEDAQKDLEKKELDVYRQLLPDLINSVRGQRVHSKDFFIE